MNYIRPLLFLVFLALALPSALAQGLSYRTEFEGVEEEDILQTLRSESYLVELSGHPPLSQAGLEQRARTDTDRLQRIMFRYGYYNATVDYDIRHRDDDNDSDNDYHVLIRIENGEQFDLRALDIDWVTDPPEDFTLPEETPEGDIPARPGRILEYEDKILTALARQGHPFGQVTHRSLVVDHAARSVQAVLRVDPGPAARFGKLDIEGLQRVDRPFILNRIAWREGEEFSSDKITQTRENLNQSGLFRYVEIRYARKDLTDENTVPVTVQLREAKMRTIGAGLRYSTQTGVAARGFWRHRNLLGQGENLEIETELGFTRYFLEAAFSQPDMWGRTDLTFESRAYADQERLDSYDRTGTGLSGGVRWQAGDYLSLFAGLGLEWSEIDDAEGDTDTFTMVSVPTSLTWDNRDNPLDPAEGWRADLEMTPYFETEHSLSFAVLRSGAQTYLSLQEDNSLIWANRARIGSVIGESRRDIPADKRLYSGGGGSVRGYGFQMAGPLDDTGDPVGGTSQLELSSELRYKLTDTIGLVGFVDAGRVYKEKTPDLSEDLFWSAGLGGRYHTPVGPVRIDLAVPLDKRPADDNYQFYVSIGQAF